MRLPPVSPRVQRDLARIVRTSQAASFALWEVAVIAIAATGGRGLDAALIEGALRDVGLSFSGLSPNPPAVFVKPGVTRRIGTRIELVKAVVLEDCVANIADRLALGAAVARGAAAVRGAQSAKAPPARPPVSPPRPAPTKAPTSKPLSQRPPLPPLVRAPVTWQPLDREPTVAALTAAAQAPAALRHAVQSHLLAAADQFDDLLSIATLHGVEAHAYQTETVRRVLRHFRGRTLLADEVGLGKTIEALMVLREYQLRGMVRRALILVPPALVSQWAGELREKAGIVAEVATDLDDTGDFWRRSGVLLASQALARLPRHAAVVQEQPWDLVIVDEAHRVKSRTTQIWKLVDGLKSRFLLLLTATPVENDLEELYNLVTLLKPGQLSTLAAFRKQFVDPKDATAARDAPRLRGILAEVMVRNTRASCGLNLPPRYVSTVAVEPSAAERHLYETVLDVFREHRASGEARRMVDTLLLEAGSSTAAVRASLARYAINAPAALAPGVALLQAAARDVDTFAKTDALRGIFEAHREKVLVFTRYRETLAEVERVAHAAGIKAVSVHGGLDRKRKDVAFQRFRDDAPLLLCTDVGSEGQNLQHCHVLVNFDLPWNPMVIEQRIGRLHRYGQTDPVRVYNLCAHGTVEERILDVLDRRVHLFELVVGEMDMVLGNLVSQQDLEERVLSIFAENADARRIDALFDGIADELAKARGQYEKVRELDQTLFGDELDA